MKEFTGYVTLDMKEHQDGLDLELDRIYRRCKEIFELKSQIDILMRVIKES